MNFFRDYGKDKRNATMKSIITGAVVLVVMASFLLGWFYFIDLQNEWDLKVKNLENDLAGTNIIKARIESEQATLDIYSNLYYILDAIDTSINYLNFYSDEQIITIIESLPENVFLYYLFQDGLTVTMEGELDEIGTLASVLHNLEATGLFTTVTFGNPTITGLSGGASRPDIDYVRFAVHCTLKGGAVR